MDDQIKKSVPGRMWNIRQNHTSVQDIQWRVMYKNMERLRRASKIHFLGPVDYDSKYKTHVQNERKPNAITKQRDEGIDSITINQNPSQNPKFSKASLDRHLTACRWRPYLLRRNLFHLRCPKGRFCDQ